MLRKQVFASLLVLAIGFALFLGRNLIAATPCELLSLEMNQFSLEQQQFHADVINRTQLFSESFKNLSQQLALLEGKNAGDLSWAIGAAEGLKTSNENLGNLLFDRADAHSERLENHRTQIESCFGGSGLRRLQEWMELDYEILTTAASFYVLYSQKVEAWQGEWRDLERNKSLLSEETFLEVKKAGSDFTEAMELNSDLFSKTEAAFLKIKPNQ